ncbi:MAG: hypothetical protein AAFQ82_05885 [Myxococcota bacterium]
MKKVLVSNGFGAGFGTWCTPGKFFAEHPKLIDAVERGVRFNASAEPSLGSLRGLRGVEYYRAALAQQPPVFFEVVEEAYEKFGRDTSVYFGGFNDCEVVTVNGPYRIDEYDGAETLVEACDQEWW